MFYFSNPHNSEEEYDDSDDLPYEDIDTKCKQCGRKVTSTDKECWWCGTKNPGKPDPK